MSKVIATVVPFQYSSGELKSIIGAFFFHVGLRKTLVIFPKMTFFLETAFSKEESTSHRKGVTPLMNRRRGVSPPLQEGNMTDFIN